MKTVTSRTKILVAISIFAPLLQTPTAIAQATYRGMPMERLKMILKGPEIPGHSRYCT